MIHIPYADIIHKFKILNLQFAFYNIFILFPGLGHWLLELALSRQCTGNFM